MSVRKRVSLSNELHLVIDSIGGIRALTRQWIDSFGGEPHVPDQIHAVLTVVIDRLRLLDRAVRGTIDPFLVWSSENDVESIPGDPSEEDVVLTAWSERKLLRHHRKAMRAAKRWLHQASARKHDEHRPEAER